MEYCRLLRLSDSGGSSHLFPAIYSPNCRGIGRQPVIISLVFIIVISVAVPVLGHQGNSGHGRILASQTISRTCGLTLYPSLCVKMLAKFLDDVEAAAAMDERDLVHISLNVTLQRFSKALYFTSAFSTLPMAPMERSAYLDCIELLDDSVDALSRSIATVGGGIGKSPGSTASTSQDVVTWLSAAMTNQDTCSDGFDEVSCSVKDQVATQLRDLPELVSNCLAIFAAATRKPCIHLLFLHVADADKEEKGFPRWLGRRERRLLQMSVGDIQADIVVSKDGNGTCNTIAEAIKKAPENSARLTVIYVRAGRYEEDNLKVGRKKMNLMFIGDGKPVRPQAHGDAEEHRDRPEPQGPEPEHRHIDPCMPDPRRLGPSPVGRLPDIPGQALEALLPDRVHAIVHRRPRQPLRMARVECHFCPRHAILRRVQELRPWRGSRPKGQLARLQSDKFGDRGQQIHHRPVYIRIVVVTVDPGGVLARALGIVDVLMTASGVDGEGKASLED
ncbi:hypothetical protein SAY86_022865 [Trapa natans]|uniref:Pectinesterase inhibitor domain-containing protein n=1 Tax=Trapa natans TaxID=22666 RepID=A0AAN7M9S6_TRANT|nr:hypothetical protein SAY86_022865 [Trapa natans]